MSSKCLNPKCIRPSRALCYVCHQSLCREHFDEHDHSVNSLLNSLNEQIKDFDDRIEQLNNQQLLENSYDQLDQWREQSYQIIDQFYQKKCQQMKRIFQENLDRQQEKIIHFQSQITQLLQEEDVSHENVNLFKSDVSNLGEEINQLEQTKFEISTQPLELEKNLITIQQINTTHFPLQQISHPYQTIHSSNRSAKPLASNQQYLLIYQNKYLSLIDQNLKLIKQIPWDNGRVWDMSWSILLNRFIVLAHYDVYLVDHQTMSIQRIQTISRRNWWSCTCSETFLFLSTYEDGSTINKFSLKPSIELIEQWTSPLTCQKDEFIKDIISNNQTIALTIFNKTNSTARIELRSINQLESLWSLQLDITNQCHNTLRCCSLNDNQWLVADFDNQRLFHITNQGKLKTIYTYNVSPWYLNLFNQNILVISTRKALHFHKL